MRDRPHADIPDSVDDSNRDSDAPTQLWSGRLSFASITPRLRAARHRQRLEALLNTQTGITFEAVADAPELKAREPRADEKPAHHQPSTTPPVVAAASASTSLSGPALALFVAVGVAVGGIAALHMDHILHPFARQTRDVNEGSQSTPQTPAFAGNAADARTAGEEAKAVQIAAVQVASAPVQTVRASTPKLRQQAAELNAPVQANTPSAVAPAKPPEADPSDQLRIPTQLHPRVNPLMTSNQVFRDK